jgi:hypothetical protein
LLSNCCQTWRLELVCRKPAIIAQRSDRSKRFLRLWPVKEPSHDLGTSRVKKR